MKKLFILLIFPAILFSQSNFRLNDKEYFTTAIVLDPNASIKERGVNVGAEIEYVGVFYVKASVTNFEVLKDGYTDVTGSAGLSFTSGYFNKIRYYAGGTGSFVTVANTGSMGLSWYGSAMGFLLDGSMYISNGANVYLQSSPGVGTANLNGGAYKIYSGTGKGVGSSNIEFWTGQKLASGTDMQAETLRLKIDNEGYITATTMPVYADNTAALAGGLTTGKFYRTPTGTLMIVY